MTNLACGTEYRRSALMYFLSRAVSKHWFAEDRSKSPKLTTFDSRPKQQPQWITPMNSISFSSCLLFINVCEREELKREEKTNDRWFREECVVWFCLSFLFSLQLAWRMSHKFTCSLIIILNEVVVSLFVNETTEACAQYADASYLMPCMC